MPTLAGLRLPLRDGIATAFIGGLVACALFLVFQYAPTEVTMRDVQRILYLHVAVAWSGLVSCLIMGACGAAYLVRRRLAWDHGSRAAAEVSWLCVTLTLVTGSLWAHEAWGVWWTWEPRLTSSLLLWLIYAGLFLTRAGVDDPHRRARISAVLALLAVADVPLVIMATRWFRGVHPVAPEMSLRMRLALLASVVAFTVLFAFLALQRRKQLALAARVEEWERQSEPEDNDAGE